MGVRVRRDMCSTCVFRPGNVMHLHAGRLAGMVKEAVANDSAIICHDTLPIWTHDYSGLEYGPDEEDAFDEEEPPEGLPDRHNVVTQNGGRQAVCRGFFDRHQTAPLQIAERLGVIDWVDDA